MNSDCILIWARELFELMVHSGDVNCINEPKAGMGKEMRDLNDNSGRRVGEGGQTNGFVREASVGIPSQSHVVMSVAKG